MEIVVPKHARRETVLAQDLRSLRRAFTASRFAALFDSAVEAVTEEETHDVNLPYASIFHGFGGFTCVNASKRSTKTAMDQLSDAKIDSGLVQGKTGNDFEQEKALTAQTRRPSSMAEDKTGIS